MVSGGLMVADRYHLEKLIAGGGVAKVYRARDLKEDTVVAVKLIPRAAATLPAAREQFERAIERRLSLRHPAIVTAFDWGELPDGGIYVAMELIEGEDLRTRLSVAGRLDVRTAVSLLTTICAGVDAAHRAGVVHADLKPENIMLPADGGPPKIVDFAGVRRVEGDGTIIGTPAYMAPEQLRGDPPCTASDVFSLGVMAYELLTGQLPFGRGTVGEVMLRQARGVTRMAGACPSLEEAVRAALAADPDRRPSTAAAFAQLLESARPV